MNIEYNGSKIILNDTWYYSRFAFNSDGNFTVATATGSYDNDSGIEFYKSTGILCISPVPSTIIGLPSVGFGDNYGATGAWIEVAEAKTTGIRLSHNVVHFYDFEDSVKPTEFAYTGNWSIASKGFQSGKSLYINGAVNDSVTLEVTGATGVSFKVNSINDTVHFMIDDKLEWISTCCAGCSYSCWKEINLPFLQDTGKHILKWTIGGSSEVWIDNIAIYTIQGACTSELAVKPYTFTPGAPAKAAEVNADFDALYKNDINLNCQIQALKTIVCQDHPTASVCQ